MPGIGDLVVNLSSRSNNFKSGIDKAKKDLSSFESSVQRAGSGITKMFGGIAVAAAGALAGLASISAVKEFAAAATVQIQAERKLQAVLAATGNAANLSAQEIRAYASELQGLTSFGDEATINAAGVLATFTAIRGDVFKEALATAQDMSSVMGSDLQGSIVQVGKALNDPIRGMSALSKVGVSFNDQQREMIKSLQESGDIMGAQRVILEELKREFGGAAQAMADPFTQVNNALGDVYEQLGFIALDIGKRFLPSAMQVINWANGMLAAFNAMPNRFQWAGDTLVAAFDYAIEHIKVNFSAMIEELIRETVQMGARIGQFVASPGAFFSTSGANIGAGQQARTEGGGIVAAQQRLESLLSQFTAAQGAISAPWEGPRLPAAQPQSVANAAAAGPGLMEMLMPYAESALQGVTGTLKKWFEQSTPTESQREQQSLQFAGAMQKGSAEAFQTILAAQGRKSAEAQATDHLTQVVQQQVGAPLQQIVVNTMPLFAPEF